MATEQGICKNCGSLLMVDSRDELCECVFCDCVFPSAEAIEIYNNPDGVEFPNLPQPKRDSKATRHVVTPVFDNVVEKAVKVDQAQNKETRKVEKLFEISPDDIKAPKKVKRTVYITTAVCILLVLGISIPLSILRHKHKANISDNISLCVTAANIKVDTESDDGYAAGYKLYGQENDHLALVSTEDVTNEQVVSAYQSFCAIRGEEKTRSPFEINGVLSQVFCLGVIAQRLNADLYFDTRLKQFTNNQFANAMLAGSLPRKGWEYFYNL